MSARHYQCHTSPTVVRGTKPLLPGADPIPCMTTQLRPRWRRHDSTTTTAQPRLRQLRQPDHASIDYDSVTTTALATTVRPWCDHDGAATVALTTTGGHDGGATRRWQLSGDDRDHDDQDHDKAPPTTAVAATATRSAAAAAASGCWVATTATATDRDRDDNSGGGQRVAAGMVAAGTAIETYFPLIFKGIIYHAQRESQWIQVECQAVGLGDGRYRAISEMSRCERDRKARADEDWISDRRVQRHYYNMGVLVLLGRWSGRNSRDGASLLRGVQYVENGNESRWETEGQGRQGDLVPYVGIGTSSHLHCLKFFKLQVLKHVYKQGRLNCMV
ncbi:hypothetical protein EDB83DRAFT_2317361 [Lactarius deliciosus]|nr:hypothetical protein EDB83DRAFT_2317361 [Lactarius deliciosus]